MNLVLNESRESPLWVSTCDTFGYICHISKKHNTYFKTTLKVKVLGAQLWSTLCESMDCGLPGSSVHEILQARILEWVAIPFSRGSSQLRDSTRVFCIVGRFSTIWAIREAHLKTTLRPSKRTECNFSFIETDFSVYTHIQKLTSTSS